MGDPRREVLRPILERLIQNPGKYAGDWAGDAADRILKALDDYQQASMWEENTNG